jgi:hypothetical protein
MSLEARHPASSVVHEAADACGPSAKQARRHHGGLHRLSMREGAVNTNISASNLRAELHVKVGLKR